MKKVNSIILMIVFMVIIALAYYYEYYLKPFDRFTWLGYVLVIWAIAVGLLAILNNRKDL